MLAASACAEPEPWWTETEHLRVFGHRDTELCAGTPPALEQEVVRLLEVMRLPEPDAKIDVGIGPEAADGCAAGYGACTGRTDEGRVTVFSPLEVVDHELVHSVRLVNGLHGPSFYEEGVAEVLRAGALGGHVIVSSSATASDIEALQLTKLDTFAGYEIAASFVGWLHARSDAQAFASAFTTTPYDEIEMRDELEKWFVDAFDLSLGDAATRWEASQPRFYSYAGPCIANDPIALQDGRRGESGRLDCDGDDTTIGPFSEPQPSVRSEIRCLQIAGLGQLVVSLDAPSSLRLELRPRSCETASILLTSSVHGGETHELHMPIGFCWLELNVRGARDVVADYRWTITAQ